MIPPLGPPAKPDSGRNGPKTPAEQAPWQPQPMRRPDALVRFKLLCLTGQSEQSPASRQKSGQAQGDGPQRPPGFRPREVASIGESIRRVREQAERETSPDVQRYLLLVEYGLRIAQLDGANVRDYGEGTVTRGKDAQALCDRLKHDLLGERDLLVLCLRPGGALTWSDEFQGLQLDMHVLSATLRQQRHLLAAALGDAAPEVDPRLLAWEALPHVSVPELLRGMDVALELHQIHGEEMEEPLDLAEERFMEVVCSGEAAGTRGRFERLLAQIEQMARLGAPATLAQRSQDLTERLRRATCMYASLILHVYTDGLKHLSDRALMVRTYGDEAGNQLWARRDVLANALHQRAAHAYEVALGDYEKAMRLAEQSLRMQLKSRIDGLSEERARQPGDRPARGSQARLESKEPVDLPETFGTEDTGLRSGTLESDTESDAELDTDWVPEGGEPARPDSKRSSGGEQGDTARDEPGVYASVLKMEKAQRHLMHQILRDADVAPGAWTKRFKSPAELDAFVADFFQPPVPPREAENPTTVPPSSSSSQTSSTPSPHIPFAPRRKRVRYTDLQRHMARIGGESSRTEGSHRNIRGADGLSTTILGSGRQKVPQYQVRGFEKDLRKRGKKE